MIDAAAGRALVAALVLATAVDPVLCSRNGRLRTRGIATGGWAPACASRGCAAAGLEAAIAPGPAGAPAA